MQGFVKDGEKSVFRRIVRLFALASEFGQLLSEAIWFGYQLLQHVTSVPHDRIPGIALWERLAPVGVVREHVDAQFEKPMEALQGLQFPVGEAGLKAGNSLFRPVAFNAVEVLSARGVDFVEPETTALVGQPVGR